MKKAVSLVLAILSLLIPLSACTNSPGTPGTSSMPDIPEWSLTLEGAGVTVIKSADLKDVQPVAIEMTITNKNGESITSSFTGVPLSAVLAAAGVTEYSAISAVASDDFAAELTAKLAAADDTLVVWAIDGEPITGDTPIRLAPKSGTGNQFVKNLAKLVITK